MDDDNALRCEMLADSIWLRCLMLIERGLRHPTASDLGDLRVAIDLYERFVDEHYPATRGRLDRRPT